MLATPFFADFVRLGWIYQVLAEELSSSSFLSEGLVQIKNKTDTPIIKTIDLIMSETFTKISVIENRTTIMVVESNFARKEMTPFLSQSKIIFPK